MRWPSEWGRELTPQPPPNYHPRTARLRTLREVEEEKQEAYRQAQYERHLQEDDEIPL